MVRGMKKPSLHYQTANKQADNNLARILVSYRLEGLSGSQMVRRLAVEYGIETTVTTVHGWCSYAENVLAGE